VAFIESKDPAVADSPRVAVPVIELKRLSTFLFWRRGFTSLFDSGGVQTLPI